MIIVIKSPPGTKETTEAVNRAAELAADIILTGPASALALKDALKGFCGTAFLLDRGLDEHLPPAAELDKGVKVISLDEYEIMLKEDEAEGPF